MSSNLVLGIDTSNYKTSVAVINKEQSIVCDIRKFLNVKQGEKGLRQSDALFQHVKNLPELIEKACEICDGEFDAIAYSSKPRPVEGSYMPVFLAGESLARSIGAMMNVPVFEFSHQEGHIEAIKTYSDIKDSEEFLACHFSGGTSELLKVSEIHTGYNIDIIGGSKDIAFGQVIDRTGVLLGMNFPAGEEMDHIALKTQVQESMISPIKVYDGWLNLSGIDTQVKRVIEEINGKVETDGLVRELFERISDAMYKMIVQGAEISGINNIIMAGGVSSSEFIRSKISPKLKNVGIHIVFGDNGLSQDNAVGTALLGGKTIWR